MATVSPNFTHFETIEATVDTDSNGLSTANVSYYARSEAIMLQLLRYDQNCPLVSMGILTSARFLHGTATTEEGGVWKVQLRWKGISANTEMMDKGAIPTYTPIAQTSPIETHPQFATFAGTPEKGKQLNRALFDAKGNFERFLPIKANGTINPKGGIKSYYQASLKAGEKRAVLTAELASRADWYSVGKMCVPNIANGEDLAVSLSTDPVKVTRTWMLMNVEVEDLGNTACLLTRNWDLSGPFGWDTDIYTYRG